MMYASTTAHRQVCVPLYFAAQLVKNSRYSRQVSTGDERPKEKRLRPCAHPANDLLSDQPDFEVLAAKYPALLPFLKIQHGRARFNWRDWNAVHALAQALFAEYFGVINWCIPEGRLIPGIPNRLNYLLWVNDLLKLSRSSTTSSGY